MNEAELCELDIWIAENFMGWSRIDGPTYGPAWVDKDRQIITREVTSFPSPFMPSSEPAAFALVKREVERRGWGWRCERDMDLTLAFKFDLFIPKGHPSEMVDALTAYGESEELAGCLAVKAAVEGSNGYSD